MKKEMLINVLQPEECRIAIVEDGVLEELYVERASQESYVGNIYKGRIVNIEPSIQAAFVDFGIGRNGFLHVSDVDPAYYKHLLSKADLAEYEADMDREYGGGGAARGAGPGRGRGDRGDRGGRGPDRDRGSGRREPREVASWLEPQPARPTPAPADENLGDFGAGVVDELAPPPEPPRRQPRPERRPEPQREPAAEENMGDFGAGLIDEAPAAPARPTAPAVPRPAAAARIETRVEVEVETEEATDFGAGLIDEEPAAATPEPAAETEAEPKARRPRGRRTKKTDEAAPAEPAEQPEGEAKADEPPAEGKAKGRARRTRKKTAEGEGGEAPESGEVPPEDKPKYMGGAERRTSPADDDEPEIKPFFEGGAADDFDIEGPNDRFAGGAAESEPREGDPDLGFSDEEPEAADAPEDEAAEDAETGREPAPAHTGRGFNDDYEKPRTERERGDRSDRGDRGGRGRDRDRGDRDRGGRGGRDRDRGFKGGGGFKGGPKGGRDRGLPKPPIQEIFKRGQEVIVQVIKEGIGTKGPTLSTYISIAGRYLVLMPSLNRVGVSHKIEDHDARKRLREIMTTLSPPKGVGFIVRTAAVDRDKKELQNDLAYLLRLWQVVVRRVKRVSAPVEIYRESDMITRTIRDIFTNDIDTIWVDEQNAFSHASEFLQIVMPRYASRIRLFGETEPLFHKYGIEDEIAKIHQKRLEMPLGGSLVIEQTEALVAIDVNSGNFRADSKDAEETAFQMNLHAAREIARQLRLRDLGGVIVNDFIDMRSETHRRKVEDALRDAMRRDRARTKILRISQFGLIEMTRQRIRPSLKRSLFADCTHCRGTGFVKTNESMSIEVMRTLQLAAHRSPAVQLIEVTVNTDVANYLLNRKRKEIAALEERGKMEIQIAGQVGVSPDTCLFKCYDANGNEVRLLPVAPPPRLAAGRGPRGPERRYPQPLG